MNSHRFKMGGDAGVRRCVFDLRAADSQLRSVAESVDVRIVERIQSGPARYTCCCCICNDMLVFRTSRAHLFLSHFILGVGCPYATQLSVMLSLMITCGLAIVLTSASIVGGTEERRMHMLNHVK